MKKTSLVSLAIVIIVAAFVLIIYQVKTISGSQSDRAQLPENEAAIVAFKENCALCHGDNGDGVGSNPSLIANDYTVDQMKEIIQHGLDTMPAFPNIKEQTLSKLSAYVAQM